MPSVNKREQPFRAKSLADAGALAFAKVFAPGSWNPKYEKDVLTFNGEVLKSNNKETASQHEENITLYYKSSLIQLTSFLHIANICPLGEKPASRHIRDNTVFTRHPFTGREVFNTLMLFFTPLFAIYNLVRLFTEFFPYFFVEAIEYFIYRCEENKEIAENTADKGETSNAALIWQGLSLFLSRFLLPGSSLVKIIMRATTSPEGFIEAYYSGAEVGGPFLGVMLATLSLIVSGFTLAALTLLLPPIGAYFNADIALHIANGLSNTPALLTFLNSVATFCNVSLGGTALFFYGFLTGLIAPLAFAFRTCCPDLDNKWKVAGIKKTDEEQEEQFSEEGTLNLHSSLFLKRSPEESIGKQNNEALSSSGKKHEKSSTQSASHDHSMEECEKIKSLLFHRKSSSTKSGEYEESDDLDVSSSYSA